MGISTRNQLRYLILTIILLLSVFSTPSKSFTLPHNSLDKPGDKEIIETQQEIAVNVQDITQMEVLVDLPQLKPPKDIVRNSEKSSQITEIPEVEDGAHHDVKANTTGKKINQRKKQSSPDKTLEPVESGSIAELTEQVKDTVLLDESSAVSNELIENNVTLSDEKLTLDKNVSASQEKSIISETVTDLKQSSTKPLERVNVTEVNITVEADSGLLSITSEQKQVASEEVSLEKEGHSLAKDIIEVSERRAEKISIDISHEKLERPSLIVSNTTFEGKRTSSANTSNAENSNLAPGPQMGKSEHALDEKTTHEVKNPMLQEGERKTDEQNHYSKTDISKAQIPRENGDDDEIEISKPAPKSQGSSLEDSREGDITHEIKQPVIQEEEPTFNEQTNGQNQTPRMDNSKYHTSKGENDDGEETETEPEKRESSDQPLSLEQRIAAWLLGKKRKDQDEKSSLLLENNKEVRDSQESSTDKISIVDQEKNGDSLKKGTNVNEKRDNSRATGDKSTKKRFGSSISASAAMKNPEGTNVDGHFVSVNNENIDSVTDKGENDRIKRTGTKEDTKILESDEKVMMKTVADDEKPKNQVQAGHKEKIETNSETDQGELEPELSEPAWLSDVPLTTMRENSRGHIQDKSLRESSSEEFLTSSDEDWTKRHKNGHAKKSSTAFKSQLNFEKNKEDYEDIDDLNSMLHGNVIYNDDIGQNNDKENNYYKNNQAYYYNYDPEKMNLAAGLKPPYLEYSSRDFNDRANFYYEEKVKSGDEIPWDREEKIPSSVYHHEHAPTAFQTLENFVEEKPNFGKKKFSKTHSHRYDVHEPGKHVEISPFMARLSISKKKADEALAKMEADNEKEKQEDIVNKNLNLDSDMAQEDTAETKQKVPPSLTKANEKKDGTSSSSGDENLKPVTSTKTADEENNGAPIIPAQEQNLPTRNTMSQTHNESKITVEIEDKNKTVTISISSKQPEPKTRSTIEHGSEPSKDQFSKTGTAVSSGDKTKSVADRPSSSSNKNEPKSGATPVAVKPSTSKTSTDADPTVVSQDGVISNEKVGETTAKSSKKVKNKDNLLTSDRNPTELRSEPDTVGHVNISNENSKLNSNDNEKVHTSLNKQESRETHSNDLKSQPTSDSKEEEITASDLQKTVATSKDKNNTADSTTSQLRDSVISVDIKINEANGNSSEDKSEDPLPKLESLLEAFKAPSAPASIDKRETKAVLKPDDKPVVLTLNEKGPAKKEEQQLSKASSVTVSASMSQAVRGNVSSSPSTTAVVIPEKFHEVNNSDSLVPFLQKDAVANDRNPSTSNETVANEKGDNNETGILPPISTTKASPVHEVTSNESSDSNTNGSLSLKGDENARKQNPSSKSKVDPVSGSHGIETSNSKAEPQISNFAPHNPFSRKLLSIADLETDINNSSKSQTVKAQYTSNATMSFGNDSTMSQSSKATADDGHEFYDEVQNVTIQAATTAKSPVSIPHGNAIADKKSANETKTTIKQSGDQRKKPTNATSPESDISETKQKDLTLKDDSVSIDTFLSSQSNKTSSKATSGAEKKSGEKLAKNVSTNQEKSKGSKVNDTATEVMANESGFHTQSRNFTTKSVSPPSVVSQNITGKSDNKNLPSKSESGPAKKLNTTSVSSQKSDVTQATSILNKSNIAKNEGATSRPNSKPSDQKVKESNDKKTTQASTGGNATKSKDPVKPNSGTPKKNEDVKNTTSGDAKSSTEKVLKTVGGLPYYSSAAAAPEVPPISAYRLQDFSLSKPIKNDKKDEKKDKANDKKDKKDDPKTKSDGANETKGEKDKSGDDGCKSSCNQESNLPPARPQAAVSAVLTSHFGPTKDEMVPFDLELLDLADNYDNTTGMFICTIPGTYVISLYLMSHPGAKVNARVFINNRPIAALWADDAKNAGFYPSSSTQTIAQLGFGDQVYVMLVDGGYGESWVHANYNVFTVFLLYEQLF